MHTTQFAFEIIDIKGITDSEFHIHTEYALTRT